MAPARSRIFAARAERLDPAQPAAAAQSVVTRPFSVLAPSRSLLVAVVTWGDRPGTSVASWTLEGIRAAADKANLTVEITHVPATPEPGPRRGFDSFDPPAGRAITVDIAGGRRPRRIPQAWIGRHLCLVAPCLHVRDDRSAKEAWLGPARAALTAFGRACARTGDREPFEVGARLVAQAFASATMVFDATWWASLRPDEGTPPELFPLERCFSLATVVPDEDWALHAPEELDAWLEARLQLTPMARARAFGLQVTGSGMRGTWPRSQLSERSVAGQALEALWTAGRRRLANYGHVGGGHLGGHAGRLPAAAPGPFARQWASFHELRGPKLDPPMPSRGPA